VYAEIAPFRVKTVCFASGERFPAIVDANGILAYAPTLYGSMALRSREGSSGTMEAHLRAIMIALNWAAGRKIDLQARIESVDLLTTFEIESLRTALRINYRKEVAAPKQKALGKQHKSRSVNSSTYYNRCHMVRDYLAWHARNAIQRIKTSDPKLPEARYRLESFERLMAENLSKPKPKEREGIDERTQELFLEAIKPGSPLNPFQTKHQHRNHALLLVYYETSIRRAEGLKLKGEHLIGLGGSSPTIRIIRDPDDPDDPRGAEPRVKTYPRDIPVSLGLAKALQEWVVEHRTDAARYPGAKRTPYVFVSRTGKPLGLRTVNDMFDLLRHRVPELPRDLTTHVLRHTGNDRLSAAADAEGLNEAEEKKARNYVMGWSKTSAQGDRYTKRHTRRRAEALMTRMQQNSVKGKNR
jgi:site-specific recombinase XerD